MRQFHTPNEKEISGPFLLSEDDLNELDKVISDIDQQLLISVEKYVKNYIDEEIKNGKADNNDAKAKAEQLKSELISDNNSRAFYFRLGDSDRQRYEGNSISDLLKDPVSKTTTVIGLEVILDYGRANNFALAILPRDENYKLNFVDADFYWRVACFEAECKRNIVHSIDHWVSINKKPKRAPAKPLQLWANYGKYVWYLCLLPVFFVIGNFLYPNYESYYPSLKQEADQLLNSGVNEKNFYKALEVELKINTGYKPPNFVKRKIPPSKSSTLILVISLLLAVIAYFSPKTTFGIGKMNSKYEFYKFYIRAVFVTIPVVGLLNPMLNKLIAMLYN